MIPVACKVLGFHNHKLQQQMHHPESIMRMQLELCLSQLEGKKSDPFRVRMISVQ